MGTRRGPVLVPRVICSTFFRMLYFPKPAWCAIAAAYDEWVGRSSIGHRLNIIAKDATFL